MTAQVSRSRLVGLGPVGARGRGNGGGGGGGGSGVVAGGGGGWGGGGGGAGAPNPRLASLEGCTLFGWRLSQTSKHSGVLGVSYARASSWSEPV